MSKASEALREFFRLAALDYSPSQPGDRNRRWVTCAKDVTIEYLQNATPGKGVIEYEQGYDRGKNAAEVSTAQYNISGDITPVNAYDDKSRVSPDCCWHRKDWELKGATSINSADKSL